LSEPASYRFIKSAGTAQSKLCDKLCDLKLANRFGGQVIAVNRLGKLEGSPNANFVIAPGDNVVIIGERVPSSGCATTSRVAE